MSGLPRLLVVLLVIGSLSVAACQPTVDVSQALGTTPLPSPAPPDPRLVPVRPSAIEGARVFQRAQCVVCHGSEGRGDGPAAANLRAPGKNLMTDFFALLGIRLRGEPLPSRPANFHNTVAMRLNSPFSMYETVTRGRPHTAMPAFPPKGGKPAYGATAFGVNLTDEERWHVVFHEWTYQSTLEEILRGKRLYESKAVEIEGFAVTCASCHGTAGDGRGPRGRQLARLLWNWSRGQGPGIFTDINLMAQRKPSELYQAIVDGRGLMPGYRGKLTDDEIWALVNYVYTFVYDYPWPQTER
ncbi:MAG: c-type cytochrome [Armatimonadota bacterium]|nr:c-type cytochrome [Armatimonadota bacterium]MDR7452356.1 c-type cytochrome [Armatimonadota bacterium]MDR7466916.1 c-type cytochrome [Armatimonadota bacterium]MDR7493542.1 c-type cytochrome [Armatimonadota bacterium]MDR7498807.1 c-type cytochrome [Armatimonadota bacterium]